MTDVQRIVDYLSSGLTLTALEAAYILKMPKFTSRVSDALRMGHKILDNWVYSADGKRYKRYFMENTDETT